MYAFPYNVILRIVSVDHQKALKAELLKKLYSEKEYCVMSFFPKVLDNKMVKGTSEDFSNVAIVIQGPIIKKDDFTVNTVRIYQQYYNNVKIVVSTWEDSDKEVVRQIRDMGVKVLLNKYPEFHGYKNINYQMITSYFGVKEAYDLGARYVFKTRADQRFYNPCALSMLRGEYQEGKIIFLGGVIYSFYSRSIYISDFATFGSLGEILMLYDGKLCTEEEATALDKSKERDLFRSYIEYVDRAEINCLVEIPEEYNDAAVKYTCPEISLTYNYFLKKDDIKNYSSLKSACDNFLKKHAIIIDADSLGFYWLKYNQQVLRPSWFDRPGKLDASKWIAIKQMKD